MIRLHKFHLQTPAMNYITSNSKIFLSRRILAVPSADEFYMTMGLLTQEMLDNSVVDADDLIKVSNVQDSVLLSGTISS